MHQPSGVTKAYIYLFPHAEKVEDVITPRSNDAGYWMELHKNFRYDSIPVLQANISDYILEICDTETITYMIRLVYLNDVRKYAVTSTTHKLLIPKKPCNSSSSSSSTPETSEKSTTTSLSSETEKSKMNFDNSTSDNSEIFMQCTVLDMLFFSLIFNSCFVGILFVIVRVSLYMYYKFKI